MRFHLEAITETRILMSLFKGGTPQVVSYLLNLAFHMNTTFLYVFASYSAISLSID